MSNVNNFVDSELGWHVDVPQGVVAIYLRLPQGIKVDVSKDMEEIPRTNEGGVFRLNLATGAVTNNRLYHLQSSRSS